MDESGTRGKTRCKERSENSCRQMPDIPERQLTGRGPGRSSPRRCCRLQRRVHVGEFGSRHCPEVSRPIHFSRHRWWFVCRQGSEGCLRMHLWHDVSEGGPSAAGGKQGAMPGISSIDPHTEAVPGCSQLLGSLGWLRLVLEVFPWVARREGGRKNIGGGRRLAQTQSGHRARWRAAASCSLLRSSTTPPPAVCSCCSSAVGNSRKSQSGCL